MLVLGYFSPQTPFALHFSQLSLNFFPPYTKCDLSLEVDFFPHITAEIQRRGWEALADKPEDTVAPVVREFYSGIEEGEDVLVVRGVRVSFFLSCINNIYHIADITDDDFLRFLLQPFDEVHVTKVLCGPGIDWIHTNSVAVHLRETDLTVSNQI